MRASEPGSAAARAAPACRPPERTNESATKSAPDLGGEREVGDVLVGDRRQLGPGEGHVDPLARRQRPGRDARGRRPRPPRTRSTARRGTPSPITISERSVTRRAKSGKSTSDPVGIARLGSPRKTTVSPAVNARAPVSRRQPQLRALEVEQQAQRPPRAPGRRAHLARRGGAGRRRCRGSSSAARSRRPPRPSGRARPGRSVAGPSVATILVCRPSMRSVSQPAECRVSWPEAY